MDEYEYYQLLTVYENQLEDMDEIKSQLKQAREFLLKIHADIYGDDYGDLMCEFDDDFVKEIEQFIHETSEL